MYLIPAINGAKWSILDAAAVLDLPLVHLKSIDEICDDIFKITLICRHYNITTIFISSVAYSTKENLQLIRNLNGLLYNACKKCGFHFVYNGAVSKCDLWKRGHSLFENWQSHYYKKPF